MKHIAEAKFWKALEESHGIYAQAGEALGISRQAVKQRADKDPERYEHLEETGIDVARGVIKEHMELKSKDDRHIRQRAAEFLLRYKGSKQHFIESSKVDLTSKGDKIEFPVPQITRTSRKAK